MVPGVSDGLTDPPWAVGAATAPAGARPGTQAAVAATPTIAVRASRQDRTPPSPGAGEAPRGVWHPRGRPTGVSGLRLADQYRVHLARQPHDPPACGGGRTTGQHAVQGRGGLAAA